MYLLNQFIVLLYVDAIICKLYTLSTSVKMTIQITSGVEIRIKLNNLHWKRNICQ